MSQNKISNLFYTLVVIVLATLLTVALIYAWQEPSSAPPGGNVPAPINVGDTAQIKRGPLQVSGFKNIGDSTFDNPVAIKEIPTVPSATTDYGKLYVKADGNLYFQNDAGAEVNLSGGGGPGGFWTSSGANISNINIGNVGIGLANPSSKLEVKATEKTLSPFHAQTMIGQGIPTSASLTHTSETDWNAQTRTNLQVQDGDVLLAEAASNYSIISIGSDTSYLPAPTTTYTTYRTITLPSNVKAILAKVGFCDASNQGAGTRVLYGETTQDAYSFGWNADCVTGRVSAIYLYPSIFDSGTGGNTEFQGYCLSMNKYFFGSSAGYYISGSGYTLNILIAPPGDSSAPAPDDWVTFRTAEVPSTARDVIVFHASMPQYYGYDYPYCRSHTRVLYKDVETESWYPSGYSTCGLGYSMSSIGYTVFNAEGGGTLKIQMKRDSSVCGTVAASASAYYLTPSSKYVSSGNLVSTDTSVSGAITKVTPSWNATLNGQTITVDISVDGGNTWTTNVSSGGVYTWSFSPSNNKLKYRVNFSTTDTFKTPILHDITLSYTYESLGEVKTAFYIQANTGNVGIGTTAPATGYKLDVEGKIQATAFDVGDITFRNQKTQEILWRLFEDEDGLYLENVKTGKVYRFILEEVNPVRNFKKQSK